MNLAQACTPSAVGKGAFVAEIPDGWQQGRGAFGGLVIGLLARAILFEESWPLRSLTAHLCGPVLPGTVDIEVEVLRRGSGLCTVAARLRQGEGVCAHAVADLGKARNVEEQSTELAMPTVPPWEEVPAVAQRNRLTPPFTQHFQYRPVKGFLFSQREPETIGWLRALDPGPTADAVWLSALIDAWWLSTWVQLPAPRPAATIAYVLHGIGDFSGVDPTTPLLFRGRTQHFAAGFAVEQRELWTGDGRLLGINHQTQVIIQ